MASGDERAREALEALLASSSTAELLGLIRRADPLGGAHGQSFADRHPGAKQGLRRAVVEAAREAHQALAAQAQGPPLVGNDKLQVEANGDGGDRNGHGSEGTGSSAFEVVATTALAPSAGGPGVYFSGPERWTGRFTLRLLQEVTEMRTRDEQVA